MPPKQQKQGGGAKVKEDKTFGLKNKNKSAKVQQQVKILQQQAAQKGQNKELSEKQKEKEALAERKKREQAKKDELNALFSPLDIVQPKVPFGVDPKSVLCAFHKAGRCQKGNKCKYSHDLNQDRKAVKASIYADARDEKKDDKSLDTMDKWTDEKLKEVVSRKGNPKATTDIVCKHFIDAVESGRYGWFWECPDGGDSCKYRHALPPGFVLKSQRKKEEEDKKKLEITLEEFLEVERHKLDHSKLTPLTKETFAIWKANRLSKKEAEAGAINAAKASSHAAGSRVGMSGRDLFTFNAHLLEDSDDDGDDEDDWDAQLYKIRADREKREMEVQRVRDMDARFGGLDVDGNQLEGDTPAEEGEAEPSEAPAA